MKTRRVFQVLNKDSEWEEIEITELKCMDIVKITDLCEGKIEKELIFKVVSNAYMNEEYGEYQIDVEPHTAKGVDCSEF